MSIAPAASGVNALPLNTLAATVNTRKNVPISSTTYFRVASPLGVTSTWLTSCPITLLIPRLRS